MAVRVIHRNVDLYPTTKTETAAVFSLHDQAAYGQMAYALYGRTAHNLIQNGDFSDGTTGWESVGSAVLSVDTLGRLKIQTSLISGYCGVRQLVNTAPAKYCLLFDLYNAFGHAYYVRMDSDIVATVYSPTDGRQAVVFETAANYSDLYLRFANDYQEFTCYIDNIMLVEITEDEYNNLTVDELMAKYPYVNGTAHVQPSLVVVTGKNIAPAINETYENWVQVDTSVNTIENGYFKSSNQTGGFTKGCLPVTLKKGVTYTLSATGYVPSATTDHRRVCIATFSVPLEQYSLSSQLVESTCIDFKNNTSPTRLSVQFTPTKDFVAACIYFIAKNGDVYVKDIQVELGTTATEYKPYTETTASFPYTLRRLPNGVYDEVTSDGKLCKRLNEYTLQSNENLLLHVLTNVDVYSFSLSDNKPFATDELGLYVSNKAQVSFSERDNTDNIGKYYTYSAGSNRVYFIFAKGTTLEQAQADLAGTKLIYQLAAPITTDISPQPLIAHEKGHVIVEPKVLLTETYSDGIAVSWPIEEITRLTKIDGETRTDIDTSTATVAPDKMSFTIDGAVNGEVYEVEYTHGLDTLVPTIDYRTPIHVHVSKPTYMRIGR